MPTTRFPLKFALPFTLALALAAAPLAHAQDRGYWRAFSNTARSTTGDITLSEYKLTINFTSFTMANIHPLQPAEAAAVFSELNGAATTGSVYRLDIPGAKTFLHKQTLCGADDVQYMVTAADGRTLHVAFFSGAAMPVLSAEAMANNTTLCGTFTYTR